MMLFSGVSGVFPLPFAGRPLDARTPSRSRRVQSRHRLRSLKQSLIDGAIISSNKLFSSFSRPHTSTRTSNVPSQSSVRVLSNLDKSCDRFVSRLKSLPSQSGGDPLSSHGPSRPSFSYLPTNHDAVPLIADLVALPSTGDCVDILDVLPPLLAARYSSPTPDLFLSVSDQKQFPAAAYLVKSDAEYLRLIRRMKKLGLLFFTKTPKAVNGVFGVPKSDGTIRLILDARRCNALFVDCPAFELPTPDLIAKLSADSGKKFFVAKADISAYYHRFRLL